jgi:hypothetical protein
MVQNLNCIETYYSEQFIDDTFNEKADDFPLP